MSTIPRPVLVTGGAGFIGCNLAHRLACAGTPVRILDTLRRPGVEENLAWLQERHGNLIEHQDRDVRDARAVAAVVAGAQAVFHLAAQVAVTTSLVSPREDFEVNALGTFNVLDALRAQPVPPPLVFTSTNKVYGKLQRVRIMESPTRHMPTDPELSAHGVAEDQPLDFYSPYGCSKGAADQYVIDHARMYGLPAVCLRMSCIYGPHQFGTEDQGWVAHFLLRGLCGRPITIFGNGKQVRDILHVDDLVDAFLLCLERMEELHGRAFNIGGGPMNSLSLLELLRQMEELDCVPPSLTFDRSRQGDQPYFVADTRSFGALTGWRPRVGAEKGVAMLRHWLAEHRVKCEREAAA